MKMRKARRAKKEQAQKVSTYELIRRKREEILKSTVSLNSGDSQLNFNKKQTTAITAKQDNQKMYKDSSLGNVDDKSTANNKVEFKMDVHDILARKNSELQLMNYIIDYDDTTDTNDEEPETTNSNKKSVVLPIIASSASSHETSNPKSVRRSSGRVPPNLPALENKVPSTVAKPNSNVTSSINRSMRNYRFRK